MKTAAAKRLGPYVDLAAGQVLLAAPPRAGAIVKTTPRPEAGIAEWTLSNGATVVLKPTTLKDDQILFRAAAPGGTSLASDADFIPARIADRVIGAGGVGPFNAVALDKILAGKAVAVSPFIDEIDEGMSGGSTPQDLETMFKLLYLRFTQPRADPVAFAAMASQARALLANQMASPDVVFEQALDAAMSRGSPRRQPETVATVGQWNLATSLAFYKARFADASNFTFVFVGSFTPETIKPLVETYIASLPATHARESWRDLDIAPPSGVVETTIRKGIAPKSSVAIVFSGPFEYDDPHRLAFRTLTLLLQSRLLDTIRQELGGTYSITASPATAKFPRPDTAFGSSGRAIRPGRRRWCSGCSRRSIGSRRGPSRRTRWPISARDCSATSSVKARTTAICSIRFPAAMKTATPRTLPRSKTCPSGSRRSPAMIFGWRRRPVSTPDDSSGLR